MAHAEAQAAARAKAEAATKAQVEADAKVAEHPARSAVPEATDLQQRELPVMEDQVPTRVAGADQTAPEQGDRSHHPRGGSGSVRVG